MKSLQLSKPHLLVVVGLPGAGKSFFATQFSDTFSAPYVDYSHYSKVAGDRIGRQLANHSLVQLLRTKQTIVIEGRGATRIERRDLVTAARKTGYDVLFVWVQTEPAAAEQRATRSKAASMTKEEFDKHSKAFDNLSKAETHVVISGKHTNSSQIKVVLKRLVVARETNDPDSIRQLPRRNRTMG